MDKISYTNLRPVKIAGPTRLLYDEKPDYHRPVLEICETGRENLKRRLAVLYGKKKAEEALPELERVMKVFYAHKPVEMIRRDQEHNPGNLLPTSFSHARW